VESESKLDRFRNDSEFASSGLQVVFTAKLLRRRYHSVSRSVSARLQLASSLLKVVFILGSRIKTWLSFQALASDSLAVVKFSPLSLQPPCGIRDKKGEVRANGNRVRFFQVSFFPFTSTSQTSPKPLIYSRNSHQDVTSRLRYLHKQDESSLFKVQEHLILLTGMSEDRA